MLAFIGKSASFAAFALLLVLIVWLPIPWGSNRVWSSLLMSGMTSIILMFYSVSALISAGKIMHWPKNHIIVCGTLSAWLVYILIQTIPIPFEVLHLISPESFAAYSAAGNQSTGYLSLDVDSTRFTFLRYVSYVVLFGLTWVLANSRTRNFVFIATVFGVGVLESILGIGLWSSGKSLIPHTLSQGQWSRTTGTFVNRNHYACHLALTFCAGIGLLIMNRGLSIRSSGVHRLLGSLLDNLCNGRALIIVGLVTIICAMLLSGSVGGFLSLIVALGVMLIISLNHLVGSLKLYTIAGVVTVITGFAVLFTGGGKLWSRALEGSIELNTRIEQWLVTWDMFKEYSLFGVGAGNYAVVFPSFHNDSLPRLQYDHVHNDYLELLVNQGVVGFFMLAFAMIVAGSIFLSQYRKSRSHLVTGGLFATLSGMLVMFIHALAEFNFHIPSNAAYFFILVGLGMSVTQIKSNHRKSMSNNV